MAHNKFNMNVNEAQIKIQHWMGKIKMQKMHLKTQPTALDSMLSKAT